MGRLLLLSMFFVSLSIQAQECSEPIAGRTSHIFLCQDADPVNLQELIWAIETGDNAGKTSDPSGSFKANQWNVLIGTHILDPSDLEARDERYRFDYRVTNECGTDEAIIYVYIVDSPEAGDPDTIFLNPDSGEVDLSTYLSEGATLGGYWTDEEGNILTNGIFNPLTTGSGLYTYNVEVKDSGTGPNNSTQYITCSDTAVFEIIVGEQVTICHKGQTLKVNYDALAAHQAHGDTLGACPVEAAARTLVYPNPSRGEFNFSNSSVVLNKVRILNFDGELVCEFETSGDPNLLEVNLDQLRKGIYFAEVFTANGKEVHRLVKK